ncbi:hypothetical protein [Pseudomonas sp. NPDC089401]
MTRFPTFRGDYPETENANLHAVQEGFAGGCRCWRVVGIERFDT